MIDPTTPTIEETIAFVRQNHAGEYDLSGQPSVNHPLAVFENLLFLFPDACEDMQHAALLHDEMEDNGLTAEKLAEMGYSERTIELVTVLTKTPRMPKDAYGEGYADYKHTHYIKNIQRIAKSGGDASKIKIADMMHNMKPSRLHGITGGVDARFRKYGEGLHLLLDVIETHMGAAQRTGVELGMLAGTVPCALLDVIFEDVQRKPGEWREPVDQYLQKSVAYLLEEGISPEPCSGDCLSLR